MSRGCRGPALVGDYWSDELHAAARITVAGFSLSAGRSQGIAFVRQAALRP